MREDLKTRLHREIGEKFDQALGGKPKVREISEEQRRERTARYADVLIKAAMRQSR
jgi:hypothetical protein